MTDLRKENEKLKKEVDLLTRTKDKFKRDLVTLEGTVQQEKVKAWKKLVEERKNAFERFCRKKGNDLKNKNSELENKNKELTSSVSELESRRNELEAMTVILMEENEEFEKKVTDLSKKNTKLQEEKQDLSNKVQELEKNKQQLEDILAGSIKDCDNLKTNKEQLEQALKHERHSHADEAQKDVPLPADWEEMPEHKNCKVCPVTGDTRDMVERRFMATIDGLPVKIIKVDRVQNRCLYKQYHLKKSQISLHSRSSKENLLWHGTHGEAVYGITVNGFDRGYKGHNVGTIYGQGVYFSTSSRYSVDYSKDDINKEKHMFLARVLTGDSTQGKPEYKVLPIKDHSSYTRYDSLVNNQRNPSIYVIMNDTQAYPEYLITYEVTGT